MWGTTGPTGLKRKDSCSTTCLQASLKKGDAKKCEQKTRERPKVSLRKETWERPKEEMRV